jgi:hypothetical protein
MPLGQGGDKLMDMERLHLASEVEGRFALCLGTTLAKEQPSK